LTALVYAAVMHLLIVQELFVLLLVTFHGSVMDTAMHRAMALAMA